MATVEVKYVDADLGNNERVRIPYWDIRSRQDGPCVLVTAVQHGNEVQSAEVLRRVRPVLQRGLRCGRCLLMPMTNVQAVQRRQPHIDFTLSRFPGQVARNNLNCTWPGRADGNASERLTHALTAAVVEPATHCLDLHCWNVFWAATALARKNEEQDRRLVKAFALRFANDWSSPPPPKDAPPAPCTIGVLFRRSGRPSLSVEFAGQYGMWHPEVKRGVRAVKNLFRFFGMLPGELEGQDEPVIWLDEAEKTEIKAPHSGLFAAADLATSDYIEKGTCLGHILSDVDLRETALVAPVSGYLYQFGACHTFTSEHSMMWTHPYVTQGELVVKIVAVK